MFALKKVLSALLLPPAGPLLLALFGLLLARHHPRSGRFLAGFAVLALLLMSIPLLSDSALHSLEVFPPLPPARLQEADAIVIVGGGTYYAAPEYGGDTVSAATLERCRYGARLARASKLPVLVSGGAVFGGQPEARAMAALLKDEMGVPVRFVEEAARDTRENAELSAHMLKKAGLQRIVLVSHAWHLPRAVALFQAQGLSVIPAPTAYTTAKPDWVEKLLPTALALRHMAEFLHEWLGSRLA